MFDSTDERSERGQATLEYAMISGLIAALAIYLLSLFYTGDDIETLINSWGDFLAQQVAGDRIDAQGDAWGVE